MKNDRENGGRLSSIELVEETPTVELYQSFREGAGWERAPEACCADALERSAFAVIAYRDARPIGMARVIGDGVYWYVQDVIVTPAEQGRGVGRRLMERVERFLDQNSSAGTFVGLMAARNVERFYREFGYERRDSAAPGMFKVLGG